MENNWYGKKYILYCKYILYLAMAAEVGSGATAA